MKCIFCDGEDVHDCPGGDCVPLRHEELDTPFSRPVANRYLLPGFIDARALQDYRAVRTFSPERVADWYRRFPRRFLPVSKAALILKDKP